MTIIVRAFATASEVHIFASICTNNACSWMFCFVLCSEVRFFYFTPYDTSIFESGFAYDSSPEYLYVIFENAFFDTSISFNNDIISYYCVCDEAEGANNDVISNSTIRDNGSFVNIFCLVHERILVKKFFYPLCHLLSIMSKCISLDTIIFPTKRTLWSIKTIHTGNIRGSINLYFIFFWYVRAVMRENRCEISYFPKAMNFC